MRRTLGITVAVVGICSQALGAPEASAQRYRTVEALPIYRRTISVPAGTNTVRTQNLVFETSLGCNNPDTEMVVQTGVNTFLYNDNCTTGKDSCVTAVAPSATTWTVTVFARKETEIIFESGASTEPLSELEGESGATTQSGGGYSIFQKHCGRANIALNSTTLDSNVLFGGTQVVVTTPTLPAGPYTAQTVHLPEASDTVLVVYDGNWNELGYNNNSGVEAAARLSVTQPASGSLRYLVGAYSEAGAGDAALVINECAYHPDTVLPLACQQAGNDADGDNLSNALEFELGTNQNSHDTDGDGLFDYYEVIGRQMLSGEQELRRYGASPRRKDLFVEFDREHRTDNNFIRSPPSEAEVVSHARDRFNAISTISNPDGSTGISIHFDIGAPCPSNPTVCGNWGGSSIVPLANQDEVIAHYSNPDVVAANIASVRHGLFKYILYTGGGDGQLGTYTSARAATVCVATHELGHTFRLQHWGASSLPTINHKPNYPSLMNYVFSYYLAGYSNDGCGWFSAGVVPTMDGAVSETNFVAPISLAYLSEALKFDFDSAGPGQYDFNRDGIYSSSVLPDNAPLHLSSGGHSGNGWADGRYSVRLAHVLNESNGCVAGEDGLCHPSGGPGIAVREDATSGLSRIYAYVPYLHSNGRTYPDHSVRTEDASNPLGGVAWTSISKGVSFLGHPDGEASAIMAKIGSTRRVLLLFPSQNGVLNYRYFDPDLPSAGGWTPIPGWPAGVTARNASLTLDASGSTVNVVFANTATAENPLTSNVYMARFLVNSEAWLFSPAALPLHSYFTPGLALGPNGTYYLATVTGSTRLLARGHIYYAPSVTGATWTEWTTSTTQIRDVNTDTSSTPIVDRLNLVVQPLLNGGGQPFPDGSSQLVLIWNKYDSTRVDLATSYVWRATQKGRILPTTSHGINGPAFGGWAQRAPVTSEPPWPKHSVAVARRSHTVSALYTDAKRGKVEEDATVVPPKLESLRAMPHAVGNFAGFTGVVDSDDGAVIGPKMCETLWWLAKREHAMCYCETRTGCDSAAKYVPELTGPEGPCPAAE